MNREMLCKNLWESSGVENRLINDAELSELLRGSGLGAHNGESQGNWPRSNYGHQVYSTPSAEELMLVNCGVGEDF